MEDNFEDLLKQASISPENTNDDNYFGRQTYNPMWGKLSIQEDKWIIVYNPFDKMRVDKKLMRMDEFATSIFLMLKEKYSKNPKIIEVDMEDAIKTIKMINSNCNAESVLKNIFIDGENVKFKVHTRNKKHCARLIFENKQNLIKNH